MNLTEQEIERRRENAIQLHAEGRLGGAAYGRLGGRPRKPRAAEAIAERVAGDGETFYLRLKEMVETGTDPNATKAILTLLGIEENERKVAETEELKFEQLKRNELIEYIAEAFFELTGEGILPERFIDGEFVEVFDRGIETASPSTNSTEEKS